MEGPIIAVDFDGTIALHEYPTIGDAVPGALGTLRGLVTHGARLILWTMRSGAELQDAVDWLVQRDIILWGINSNPTQNEWTQSPKAYARLYIDDAAYGCPLIFPPTGRPYVDWTSVASGLTNAGYLPRGI